MSFETRKPWLDLPYTGHVRGTLYRSAGAQTSPVLTDDGFSVAEAVAGWGKQVRAHWRFRFARNRARRAFRETGKIEQRDVLVHCALAQTKEQTHTISIFSHGPTHFNCAAVHKPLRDGVRLLSKNANVRFCTDAGVPQLVSVPAWRRHALDDGTDTAIEHYPQFFQWALDQLWGIINPVYERYALFHTRNKDTCRWALSIQRYIGGRPHERSLAVCICADVNNSTHIRKQLFLANDTKLVHHLDGMLSSDVAIAMRMNTPEMIERSVQWARCMTYIRNRYFAIAAEYKKVVQSPAHKHVADWTRAAQFAADALAPFALFDKA